jgi:hypothetical protein
MMLILLAGSANAEEWQRTYRIEGTPQVSIRTDDGSVTVSAWDRAAVGVKVTTRGWKIGANGVRITEDAEGSRIALEVKEPRRTFSIGPDGRSIEVEVFVPERADLFIGTGDGAVSIPAIEGMIRAGTGDGSLSVEGASGTLVLTTGDGALRGVDLEGSLVASTGDGSIRISGRFSELRVQSGDGSVQVEAETSDEPRGEWRIRTGDGSQSIRIPGDLRADLDIQTGDGRIELDMPVEVSGTYKRTVVRGTLNGGGPLLWVRSGDGSIRIGPL